MFLSRMGIVLSIVNNRIKRKRRGGGVRVKVLYKVKEELMELIEEED